MVKFCCDNRRFMYASSDEILEEMIAECKCRPFKSTAHENIDADFEDPYA